MFAAGTQAGWAQSLHHLQFWQQDLPRHAPVLHPLLLAALLTWHHLRQQLPLVCWQSCQQLRPASLHHVLLLLRWQQYQQLRPASLHQVLLLALLLPLLRWQQYQQLHPASLHQVLLLLLLLLLLLPLVCWQQC
jgi:hypothetical protein